MKASARDPLATRYPRYTANGERPNINTAATANAGRSIASDAFHSASLRCGLQSMLEEIPVTKMRPGTGPMPHPDTLAEADVTVVIYTPRRRGGSVVANFALCKGELDEAKCDAILKTTGKTFAEVAAARSTRRAK